MTVQSVSGVSSNLSNIQKTKFSSKNGLDSNFNASAPFKSESVDEKREAANKLIKKVYQKGFITGAVITALVCVVDYVAEHLIDKHFNKMDTSLLDGAREVEKSANNIRIPFVNSIKKLFRIIKK